MTAKADRGATPRQLEVFRAVMRAHGVSSAARVLETTQPALSYQIKALEQALGFSLFVRDRGRMLPTREATALMVEVERHFVGMETIARAAAHLRDHEAGQLNIGVLPALGYTVMPEVLARLRTAFPSVKLSLQTIASTSIKDAVATGRLDVGFVASEVDTAGVRASTLVSRDAVLVAPSDHRLASRRWIEPRDLKGEPFVALNPEDATRRPIDAAMRQAGVTLNVVAETPYATGVCALVQAGLGVGLVNPLSVQEGYRRSLKLVAFRPEIRFRHLLLLPPHQPQGRALQALIAMARAVIAER